MRSSDLDLQPRLERAQVPGRELLVEDHQLGAARVQEPVELLDLALADPVLRVGLAAALDEPPDRLGAGGVGERRELVEVLLADPGPIPTSTARSCWTERQVAAIGDSRMRSVGRGGVRASGISPWRTRRRAAGRSGATLSSVASVR